MEILSVLLLGIGMGSTRSIWIFSFAGGDNSIWSVCHLSFRNFVNDDFVLIVSFLRLWWWRLFAVVIVSVFVQLMLLNDRWWILDDRKRKEPTSLCELKV
jgi:hypothetical protein